MTHALLIFVFMAVLARDLVRRPLLPAHATPAEGWAWTLGAMGLIWLAAHAAIIACGRRLDATGRPVHAFRAEAFAQGARVAAVLVHAAGVLALGTLDAARGLVGDTVVLDEALVVAPVIAVFVMLAWSTYPLERRVRDAVFLRDLDEGRPVYAPPTRAGHVASMVRHQLASVLVPMALVLAWTELVSRAAPRLARLGEAAPAVAQVAGVVLVFGLMGPVLAAIWDTVPLGPGELRDRLLALCRVNRVRVRRILVWRTHGSMVNGAVTGLFGPLRYILITDALLDHLPRRQVEAVAAHEIAHVRRHHLAWLAVTMVGTLAAGTGLVGIGVAHALGERASEGWWGLASLVIGAGGSLAAFGYVSRRFEWQADAFAARCLSEPVGAGAASGAAVITPEAVAAMSDALAAVADLNLIPRDRPSWRHGSIACRQRRLAGLAGLPADRLPIDREARRLKVMSLVVLLVGVAMLAFESRLS